MKSIILTSFITYLIVFIAFAFEVGAKTIQMPQFRNIAACVDTLVSGDTILCDSGIYQGFEITKQFDPHLPVVIKSKVMHGAQVIAGRNVSFYGCRGLVIDGFVIHGPNVSTNAGLIQVSNHATYITIKNCHIYNAPADADCIKVNQADNISVLYCDLHDPGLRTDNTAQETLDFVDSDSGWIKGNLFRWTTQRARQYFNAKAGSRHFIVEDNIFLNHTGDVGDAAMQFGGWSTASYIDGAYEGVNQIARNNIFIGATTGAIQIRNANGAYVYNNLFYNCINATVILGCQGNGTGSGGYNTNIEIFNNIFYNSNADMPRVVGAAGEFSNFTHGNNLYFNGGGRILNAYYDPSVEVGHVFADPGIALTISQDFVSILASFAISGTGPAVNSGTTPSVSSPGVPFDIKGVARPMGAVYDIGPLEATSDRVETSPAAIEEEAIQAWPNPFNPMVTITVSRQQSAGSKNPRIEIYTLQGKLIQQLPTANCLLRAGITWDASKYPSGLYVARVLLDNIQYEKKLILAK